MPEIRASAFYWGRRARLPLSTVPMLASTGCPYRCDFCIDWDNPYRQLPADRLVADLRYLADRLPGTLIVFHDPNFAVTFDQVFDVLESVPAPVRPPYMIESSLSLLRADRLRPAEGDQLCACSHPASSPGPSTPARPASAAPPGRRRWTGSSSSFGGCTRTCRTCRRTSCSGSTPTAGPSRPS